MKAHALFYSAIGALFLAGTLQAGLVSTVNGTGHFFDLSPTPFGCSDAGTTTASCSFTRSLDFFHSASGSYQATAQYGSLDVTSMSSVFDLSGGDMVGTSSASFADTFLLTGGIGSGTIVFVTGIRAAQQNDYGCTVCQDNATVTLNTFTIHPLDPFDPFAGAAIANLPFSFTFGTPFNLSASASAYSSALGHEFAMTTAHLQIDAIEVLNANGALITNYAVTTGSGAAYAFVTPEPGTFALAIAALIAMILVVVRRMSIGA